MIDQKYEPSAQICAQRLFYYVRYTQNVEKAKQCFYEALEYVFFFRYNGEFLCIFVECF